MATEMLQQQSMRQEQTMTHHQIQALEMLTAPVLELNQIINTELEKNPLLEVEATEHESIEIEDFNNTEVSEISDNDDQIIEKILHLERSSLSTPNRHTGPSKEQEEERRHFMDSLTTEKTMQEFLSEQLLFLELEEDMIECCETIISGLDDNGYLTSHPADLSMATGEPIEQLNAAITIIHTLEPAGIGARNLQERLLIQLERKHEDESITYKAITKCFDDLSHNRLPKVTKALGITMTEVHQILAHIQTLQPYICTETKIKPSEYIQEEVIISENEFGEISAKVLDNLMPSLKVNNYYKSLLEDPSTQKEVRDYVKNKINGVMFIINSLMQRQSTIEKIATRIAKEQQNFFRHGTDHLRPLTMAQVADDAGVHETTVSRAVAGKYLRCKFGILPLRFFFSTGYESSDGKNISNMVVKKAIKELIDQENPKKAYSDNQLADILKEKGLQVARRTVAKYRENLGILPSNLRRKY